MKFKLIVLMILAALLPLSMVTTAQAAPKAAVVQTGPVTGLNKLLITVTPIVTCRGDRAYGYGTMNSGPPYRAVKYAISVVHGYDKCKNRLGPQWIRPRWARGNVYAKNRDNVNCYSHPGEVNLRGMKYAIYYSHDGRNMRKRFFVRCQGDGSFTSGVRRFAKRKTPQLYANYNQHARARTVVTGNYANYNDRTITLSGSRLGWRAGTTTDAGERR